jgi:hypothetical protein
MRYDRNVRNWFTLWFRKPKRVFVDELDLLDGAVASGVLTRADISQIRQLDFIVQGTNLETGDEQLFAVEVSGTVNVDDVERAAHRAGLLRLAGYNAIGMSGGYQLSGAAQELALDKGVIIDLHRQP